MSFVGLHIHSDYSLLDGASQLPDLIDRAIELGMPAIALTDHGVMYGAIELLKVCRNKNIKPIIGNEMYVINGDIEEKKKYRRFHQIVLAKNTQGYKNLVKLTTISKILITTKLYLDNLLAYFSCFVKTAVTLYI